VRSSRPGLFEDLRSGARTGTVAAGARVRAGLVVGQVGISLLLLVGSGLLLRSLARLTANDPGFVVDHLLTAEVTLPPSTYPGGSELTRFYTGLLEDLRALPGVRSAGMVSQLPLRDPGNNIYVWPAQAGTAGRDLQRAAYTRVILPGYLETMGIPILAGRGITSADTADAPNALVVSQTMAHALFAGREAIGQRVAVDFGGEEPVVFDVVGVAGDIRSEWIGSRPRMMMYHSYFQAPRNTMRIALRTSLDPAQLTSSVRAAVWRRDKDLPVEELASLSELVEESVSPQRVLATVTLVFAGAALLLASLGLFGVLAQSVLQRTHEIGLRMALGARRGQVLGLVLRQGVLLTAGGLAVGGVAALGLTRLMRQLLYEVVPSDPLSFAGAGLLLLVVTLVACIGPAFRATRVQPMQALRTE
jgi:predicted permease